MQEIDKERQYHIYQVRNSERPGILVSTSDCFFVRPYNEQSCCCCCNNPCTSILYAPVTLLAHLCCLQCAICTPNEEHYKIETYTPPSTIYSPLINTSGTTRSSNLDDTADRNLVHAAGTYYKSNQEALARSLAEERARSEAAIRRVRGF